ncbi:unnamed protein product [Rhodiola kirilowii]
MEMEDNMRLVCQVDIFFYSLTPVVDVEFTPKFVRVRSCDLDLEIPPHDFKFTWYSELPHCSVHHSKMAKLQCVPCVRHNIPVQDSYHCTSGCFADAWPRHRDSHHHAGETVDWASCDQSQTNTLIELEDCNHEWFNFESQSAEKIEGKRWIMVGTSKTYIPSIVDVGTCLRLTCKAVDSLTGIQMSSEREVMTHAVISAPVTIPRSFIEINHVKSTEVFNSEELLTCSGNFSVLSYNILANLYAFTDRFDYCPSWAIIWPYRRKKLLQEITGYNADIICLQEVQSDHFEYFLKPLTECGYSAVYKKRNNKVYTGKQSVIDGCATFYRCNKFREIKSYELEFAKTVKSVVDNLEENQRSEGTIRLMKDNVAVIVILETVGDDICLGVQSRVCVANTHLLANSDYPDVKIFQVAQLLKGLQTIAQLQIPVILCGDLNSLPRSDPHKLVVNGKVGLARKRADPLKICRHLDLHHSMCLASAYSCLLDSVHVKEQDKKTMDSRLREPHFTHWNKGTRGTLDYIFYQVDKLAVKSLLELFDEETLGDGIPSPVWSSDHIALMAKFEFRFSSCGHYPQLPSDPWRQEKALLDIHSSLEK